MLNRFEMNTYVALLRGVNVSGKNRIKMADLKILLKEQLRFNYVDSYIQSGNIVFQTDDSDALFIAEAISRAIKKSYSYEVPVRVYSYEDFIELYESNNFQDNSEYDVAYQHATLFSEALPKNVLELLLPYAAQEEELKVGEKCIYLFIPNGYGKTKLNNTYIEKKLGSRATTRNWKTMTKLKEMMTELVEK